MLGEDLAGRMRRIAELGVDESGSAESGWSSECTPTFHRWSRIFLSSLIDQKYSLAFYPVLKSPIRDLWPDLASE